MPETLPEKYTIDKPRIENAVREILAAIGEDPGREGVLGTPRRVAEAYEYLFSGLSEDPTRHLEIGFAEDYGNVVIVRDIYLASICEHHLLPFVGKAHLAYVPKGRVVGLSKLARVVEGYAPPAAAPGATDGPDRRRPLREPGLPGRVRGHRGRPHVHDDAGRTETRQHHRHLGGPGRLRGGRRPPGGGR